MVLYFIHHIPTFHTLLDPFMIKRFANLINCFDFFSSPKPGAAWLLPNGPPLAFGAVPIFTTRYNNNKYKSSARQWAFSLLNIINSYWYFSGIEDVCRYEQGHSEN